MIQMAEFLAFSDFHGHNFRYGARREDHPELAGKYNNRLLDGIAVLAELRDYAIANYINLVVFGGDLLHRRGSLPTDAVVAIKNELAKFREYGIDIVGIPGNHDYADRAGDIHSLQFLHDCMVVLDKPGEYCDIRQDLRIIAVPYTDKLEDAKAYLKEAHANVSSDRQNLLLVHLGMQGARVGSDYVLVADSDIQVDDVDADLFDLCLFGHYHQHQQLFKNGWYIGATYQHNWGDANTSRGFLHVRMEDGNVSFDHVETQAARRFYVLSADDTEHSPRPGDFVKYKLSANEIEDEVRAKYESAGAVVSVVDPPMPAVDMELPDDYLDPQAIINSWVDSHTEDMSEEEREFIKRLGKQFLAEAEKDLL